MNTTQDTVRAFYTSIENKDFDTLRGMLQDDMAFEGPVGNVNDADAFVAMLRKMTMLTERFEIKHLFVDGDRACCVFDLVTATPIGKSPAAEYFELREGRIAALRAHYDSQPWVALAGAGEAH